MACVLPARASPDPAQSFCDLLRNAASHDGKTVTVQGIYMKESFGTLFTDRECPASFHATANLRMAPGFHQNDAVIHRAWKLSESGRPVRVILRGRFHVTDGEHVFGPTGERYEIEVEVILEAEPVDGRLKQRA